MYSFSGNCAASVPISKFTCVCERFIHSQDRSTYFLQQNRQIDQGNIHLYSINRSQTYECRIETIAAQFLFLEYLFRIFGIGSLQCMERDKQKRHRHFCFLLHFFFLHMYLRCLLYVPDGFDVFRYCLQRWFLQFQQLKYFICSSAWDVVIASV